jgi:hypothetical protein
VGSREENCLRSSNGRAVLWWTVENGESKFRFGLGIIIFFSLNFRFGFPPFCPVSNVWDYYLLGLFS